MFSSFVGVSSSGQCSDVEASDLSIAVLFALGYFTFRALAVIFEVPSGSSEMLEVQSIDRDVASLKQSDLQPDDSQALQELHKEMLMEKQAELEHELALELEVEVDIDHRLSLQLTSKQLAS